MARRKETLRGRVAQLSDRETIAVSMVFPTLDRLAWLVGEDTEEASVDGSKVLACRRDIGWHDRATF